MRDLNDIMEDVGTRREMETQTERLQQTAQRSADTFMKKMENMSPQAYLTAVYGSMLASLLLFLMGKRSWSVFIGLWVPSLLNLGLYNKLLRPSENK